MRLMPEDEIRRCLGGRLNGYSKFHDRRGRPIDYPKYVYLETV